ncbi:MAG TPA: molybdopterin molybdotransferase MoeA [Candidatus Ruania gallistercoris]|uniref:Molybdopterin molybdenumtransferase n=1 Tax=Candidatus Ruania gallistercoris TaxID=2838746 RepID=A0A9D2EH84_9MICO|nr:molybdopterin molybdotransferase MoeA [Candidatus Ruania gallistercoris]
MSPAPRTVAEHQAAVAALTGPLPPRTLPLAEAAGCVLAADVTSRTPIPLFDNSAMDGYAVHAADLAGASTARPVTLPVVADLPAGATAAPTIAPGSVARIMTGAPMPPGADAIVPVEHTDAGTEQVQITTEPAPGAHLRRSGEDVAAGDLVLPAGTVLHAPQLAAAAACGHGELLVHPRPRVAVISTGSELVAAGEQPAWGQIPDSNSHLLAEAVREAGGSATRIGAVPDDVDAFAATLRQVAGEVDLIICSGGVSVGAYDVVKEVLAPLATMWFGPVAMQPGKPQGLGRLPEGPVVVALPGNPVSVHVSFEVFLRSALARMAGHHDGGAHLGEATVAVGWRSPSGREQYIPVLVDPATDPGGLPSVRPVTARGSGSHLVASLAGAQALARVAAETDQVELGDRVQLLRTGGRR